MIPGTLFNIPIWTLPTLNFSKKKKQLDRLVKAFPEEKTGLQAFSTNRQSDRTGFSQAFYNIMEDELTMLMNRIKKTIIIEDIWSVSYKKGDYHSPHNHGTIGFAGILYLEFPEGSQPTSYIQPWQNINNDTTMFNSLPVKEGDIVIVPKFVNHFSAPHKGKKQKRIISWDMKI